MKFFRYIVLSILFVQKSLEKSWGLCYNIIVKKSQYESLKKAVENQHGKSNPDFAHCQIALVARLAYTLNKEGLASNIGSHFLYDDVSYMAGWLGDATISEDYGTPRMDNRDYCADLDAEISYRYIVMGCSASDVLSYYFFPIANSKNRAVLFLEYIPYDNVCQKVFNHLGLNKNNNAHWAKIQTDYPDTYDFLISLENGLETMGHFPD